MRVLVLGGYGLIGQSIVSTLAAAGHDVAGLGRNVERARRTWSSVTWHEADLNRMLRPADWTSLVSACDAIVNASGVLQDGLTDDVRQSQYMAMRALFEASRDAGKIVVQISAAGVGPDARSAFMQSKAEADAALQSLDMNWVILRPGLVIGPVAYGGTALVRALASIPGLQPLVHANAAIQTVFVDDIALAVADILDGRIAARASYDLVEDVPHGLGEIVSAFRARLGYARAPTFHVPASIAVVIARAADGLGWLGWRSPFRSTAMRVVAEGVRGDPAAWKAAGGRALRDFHASIAALPAGVQERWFGRMWLLKPAITGLLSAFWAASGVIALISTQAAADVLVRAGIGANIAVTTVRIAAVADILLGIAVLVAPWHRMAVAGMLALSCAYLAGATVVSPDLWLDPLGPLVKVLPGIGLALTALAIAESR